MASIRQYFKLQVHLMHQRCIHMVNIAISVCEFFQYQRHTPDCNENEISFSGRDSMSRVYGGLIDFALLSLNYPHLSCGFRRWIFTGLHVLLWVAGERTAGIMSSLPQKKRILVR